MGKIYYMMGKSSSGKDTLFRGDSGTVSRSFEPVIPYTTRPIREGEENGVRVSFSSKRSRWQSLRRQAEVIEMRAYHTVLRCLEIFYGGRRADRCRGGGLSDDRNAGVL